MRTRLRRQVHILATCGERSPSISLLLGLSTKTVKRLYRQSHTPVRTGRPPGAALRLGGRDRERIRSLLHRWIEAMPQLLAGEAPQVLARLTLQSGFPSSAHVAAVLAQLQIGVDVAIQQCPHCHASFVAFLARGRLPYKEACCPQPQCRQQSTRPARETVG